MSGGAKAGLAIGLLLGIFALIALAVFVYKRKKSQNESYQKTDDEKAPIGGGASMGRAASTSTTRTTATAPRLSLRPVTQFLPDLGGKRKSGNALAAASATTTTMSATRSNNDRLAPPNQANHPANPFGTHAEPSEKTPAPDQSTNPANPFGNGAETLDRSMPQADVPAPLRVRTPTPENVNNTLAAAGVGAVAGAAMARKRQDAPKPLNLSPNRSASPSAMPSPASTEFSMTPVSPGALANGPPPSNVHRVQLDFKPSMDDELSLRAGQLVRLLHEYDDGWVSVQLSYSRQHFGLISCLRLSVSV